MNHDPTAQIAAGDTNTPGASPADAQSLCGQTRAADAAARLAHLVAESADRNETYDGRESALWGYNNATLWRSDIVAILDERDALLAHLAEVTS